LLKEVHARTHPAWLTLDAQTAELEAELAEEKAELAAGGGGDKLEPRL